MPTRGPVGFYVGVWRRRPPDDHPLTPVKHSTIDPTKLQDIKHHGIHNRMSNKNKFLKFQPFAPANAGEITILAYDTTITMASATSAVKAPQWASPDLQQPATYPTTSLPQLFIVDKKTHPQVGSQASPKELDIQVSTDADHAAPAHHDAPTKLCDTHETHGSPQPNNLTSLSSLMMTVLSQHTMLLQN